MPKKKGTGNTFEELLGGKRIPISLGPLTVAAENSAEATAAMVPFHSEIGRIASLWALVEYKIDHLIWSLMKVEAPIGACVTSQIASTYLRLKALVALATYYEMPSTVIDELNRLSTPLEKNVKLRNRAVHDPLFYSEQFKKVLVYRISADRKLDMGIKIANLSDYEKDRRQIMDFVIAFEKVYAMVIAALPSAGISETK